MNTNNTQTVLATAPETNKEKQQIWTETLAEKISPTEVTKLASEVKREYEEIYQNYHDTEIISLLILDKKYDEEFDELLKAKGRHQSEANLLDSAIKLYPQILNNNPEIETDMKSKHDYIITSQHEFNGEYIFMLRSQQKLLNELLEKNLAVIKELNKNNKQTRADEEADPYLKDDKKERKSLLALTNKELKKKIGENAEIILIFRIKELIESRCTMIFTRATGWVFSMEFEDDCMSVKINDEVRIFTKGSGWNTMGPLHHFNIDTFLQKIPNKYWAGMNRDKQIESIFED